MWGRSVRKNKNVGQKKSVIVLISITALSLIWCFIASKAYPATAFYFIGCRLWELAFGVSLFLITCKYQERTTEQADRHNMLKQVYPWIGVGLNLIALCFAKSSHFPWPWATFPTVGTLLLIGSALTKPKEHIVRVALSSKPMVWIGKRSYSLYLWHWPVYVLLRWTLGLNSGVMYAIAALITFTLSIFSFRCIEQPFRHNPWIEVRPKLLRITAFCLLPIAGFSIAMHLFRHKQNYSLSRVMRNKVDWYSEKCMPYPNVGERHFNVNIQYNKIAGGTEVSYVPVVSKEDIPRKKIYVLGDSHAGAFSPMYEQISAEQGVSVNLFSFSGCSYLDLKSPMNITSKSNACIEFSEVIKNITASTSNPGDIVLLPSLRMDRYGDQWASFDITDMHEHMYNSKAQKLRDSALEDAKQWLQPFYDKHLKVVFVAPTPVFKSPTFRCSDWFNENNPICVGQNQQSRTELEQLRKPIVNNMNSLAKIMPNIHIWDPFPLLCPQDVCRTFKDDRPLFFDGDHVSAYGNLVLYPDFKKMITDESQKSIGL